MEATEPQLTTPKPKPRCFRHHRRALLLVVLLSIGMSWFAVKMQRAKKQREAVESIAQVGGKVLYDYKFGASGAMIPNSESPWPAWARQLLGDDFFSNVVWAIVKKDAGVERLAGLSQLRVLYLHNSEISDAGLVHLEVLGNLTELNLWGSAITDTGLTHVERLSRLESLNLGSNRITDAGMVHLGGLSRLQSLAIGGTAVTDTGLAHLTGLIQLRELYLGNTRTTDEGVRKLQKALPNCQIIR
jgi:hypothetical protein